MLFAPEKPLQQSEFIVVLGLLFATLGYATSAILPAIPDIAREMTPDDVNRAQLIVTSFVLGMGVGTLFVGPLSDALGRKPVIIAGLMVYLLSAIYGSYTTDIGHLLVSRVMMGIGGSSAWIVTLAMVRDLYSGREMARLMSFVMTVFVLVPAIAPSIGAAIIHFSNWRGIFISFVIIAVIAGGWLTLRQPETHPKEKRRPPTPKSLFQALITVLGNRSVVCYTLTLSFTMAQLLVYQSALAQVFDVTFQRPGSVPCWFGIAALFTAAASFLNANLVMRLGMHKLAISALIIQFLSATTVFVSLHFDLVTGDARFYIFVAQLCVCFCMLGLIMGNINALAMEPMGMIAGFAASIIGSVSTIFSVLFAVPVGFAFDGTSSPIVGGQSLCAGMALFMFYLAMRWHESPEETSSNQ